MTTKQLKRILDSNCTEIVGRSIRLYYFEDDLMLEASYEKSGGDFEITECWIDEKESTLTDKQEDIIWHYLVKKLDDELESVAELIRSATLIVNGSLVW